MKTEVIFSLFVGIAVSIGGAYYYIEIYGGLAQCGCSTIAGPKSNMKQIGTTVAMYFYDNKDQYYPASPDDIGIDPILLQNSPYKTWNSLNLNSQYFFFAREGKEYTGNNDQPLAITKKEIHQINEHLILWEDGHVSTISEVEAEKLKDSFIKERNNDK